ncbi:energy transducer TonB [bacterium]|nr:energy transducer TonB [bacterium]
MKTDLFLSLGIAATTHVVAIFAFNEESKREPHQQIDDFVWICDFPPIPQVEPLDPAEIPDEIVDYSDVEAGSSASDIKSNIESSSAQPMAGGPILPKDQAHSPIEIPLNSGPINIGPNAGPGSWAPRGLPGIENLDETPKVISQILPRYPHDMRRSGIDGEVMVKLVVGPDGRVRAAEAVKYSHRPFAEAATAAVKKWRFQPGKRQGRRVAFRVTVPVLFSVTD